MCDKICQLQITWDWEYIGCVSNACQECQIWISVDYISSCLICGIVVLTEIISAIMVSEHVLDGSAM